jgi:excisionase family DNA binding protein
MPKNIGRGSVMSARISIPEIARRLDIGRLAVYSMLEQGLLPGIRIGRRWLVTRNAYEQWERTCGMQQVLSSGTLDLSPSSA